MNESMETKLAIVESITTVMGELNKAHREIIRESKRWGMEPHQMKNKDGTYMLIPVITAKANLLNALVELRGQV